MIPEKFESVKFDIPREIKICSEEGLIYTAGYIARKMKKTAKKWYTLGLGRDLKIIYEKFPTQFFLRS